MGLAQPAYVFVHDIIILMHSHLVLTDIDDILAARQPISIRPEDNPVPRSPSNYICIYCNQCNEKISPAKKKA